MESIVFPALQAYIYTLQDAAQEVSPERKKVLQPLIQYLADRLPSGEIISGVFICTHNSRRSQLAQCWSHCLSWYFQVPQIAAYSGGTEVTAFHPNAVAALERAGWQFASFGNNNPIREARFSPTLPPLVTWSKRYDDPSLPASNFAALMTCSEADEACPVIVGAEARIALNYLDPKEADGTPEEAARYDERCFQIAAELYHVFQQAIQHVQP